MVTGPPPPLLGSPVCKTKASLLSLPPERVLGEPGLALSANILEKTVLASCSLIAVKINSYIQQHVLSTYHKPGILSTPPETAVDTNKPSPCPLGLVYVDGQEEPPGWVGFLSVEVQMDQ